MLIIRERNKTLCGNNILPLFGKEEVTELIERRAEFRVYSSILMNRLIAAMSHRPSTMAVALSPEPVFLTENLRSGCDTWNAPTELTHGYLVHTRSDGTRMASAVGNSGTPPDSVHDIELSTSIDWTTPFTRVLTPPNIAAGSLDTNRRALPVLVMRPDTQEIEIFLSLNYDGGGCRLVKGGHRCRRSARRCGDVDGNGQDSIRDGTDQCRQQTPRLLRCGNFDVLASL